MGLTLKKNKLLLVEGKDAWNFFIWALNAYKIENIQVEDFGGITQLSKYLTMLALIDGYKDIETILIARDAETDANRAVDSIKKSLDRVGLAIPGKPFEFAGEKPGVCYMLFPGHSADGTLENGTLEDLCIKTINDIVMEETDSYLARVEANHYPIKKWHKSKLYAYLAAKNEYVGAKLGEAAKYGAWDWNSKVMDIYKDILAAA